MFKDFEKTFKVVDYIFKFISWNILISLVEYVAYKHDIFGLKVLFFMMVIMIALVFSVLIAALISRPLGIIRDKNLYTAIFAAIWFFVVSPATFYGGEKFYILIRMLAGPYSK